MRYRFYKKLIAEVRCNGYNVGLDGGNTL